MEWKLGHCAHLFWGVARDHRQEMWNCELVEVLVNVVQALGFSASGKFQDSSVMSQTTVVTVPVLTNTREIKKDEQVILKWTAPPKKEKEAKEKTWITEATAKAKQAPKRKTTDM